jgi:hypothetical protein
MLRPGPAPICICGECRICKTRAYRDRYYKRNRGQIIPQNTEAKRRRRDMSEVSDAELDRRALVMMGRLQDAR